MSNSSIVQAAREGWGHMVIPGALHIVSTPIGNLGDITLRAIATLAEATLICCEDTRVTRQLLAHFGITSDLMAVHSHNETTAVDAVLSSLRAGGKVALVSDAGTPLLSDPGVRLVSAAVEAGCRVVPVPGASALLAALVASGFPPQPVTFFGFIPRKGPDRSATLETLASLSHTAVLFESPHRLTATLRDLASASASQPAGAGTAAVRRAVIAREMTKVHEEFRRGTLEELIAYYEDTPPRGETLIVLAGVTALPPAEHELLEWAAGLREEGFRPREIVQRLMDEHGLPRNLAYRLAHEV